MKRSIPVLALTVLLLLPVVAAAKPVAIPNFGRLPKLRNDYLRKIAERLQAEAFDKLAPEEKLVTLYEREQEKLDGKPLTAERVVRDLLAWYESKGPSPGKEQDELMKRLAEALGQRLNLVNNVLVDKDQRHKASKPLVDGLMHKQELMREISIECLFRIYGTRKLYRANGNSRQRRAVQRDWKKFIETERRR